MKRKILITGATGFVGSCVTRAFVHQGEDVSILVRNKELNWRLQDISPKLKIYECDLLDPQLSTIVKEIKPNIIMHLAAYGALPSQKIDTKALLDVNVKGLINLINASSRINLDLFINTGSSSEYGVKDTPMNENGILAPINDYGVSKAAATLFCQKAAITEQLPIITLRLFSPYGYYDDYSRLIPYVISKALKNEPIALSSKKNVRDFIYIEDVIKAYVNVISSKNTFGDIINIGSGKQHSVEEVVDQIISLTKSTSIISWGKMPTQSRQLEPKVWQANIEKAKRLLSWQPAYTLEHGLKETIKQFRKN